MADNGLLDVEYPQNANRLVEWYLHLFNENPEFLFNHVITLSDGYAIMGTTLDDFRQMLVTDNFRFLQNAADQNNDDIDELIISVFEVMEDNYPGFTDAFREAAPELGAQFTSGGITLGPLDDTPSETPDPETTEPEEEAIDEEAAPEPEPEPEPEPDIPAEPEVTAEPEIITPPPAGSRGNPIQPRIEIDEPAMRFDQVIETVQDIQTQLANLPDDPAQSELALYDISNALEEMAIALTPSAAHDARLHDIPPRASDATFEGELESLNGQINTILLHNDTSGLTEYLVRASQQANITAREAAALIEPDIDIAPLEAAAEAETAPESVTEEAAETPEDGAIEGSEPSEAPVAEPVDTPAEIAVAPTQTRLRLSEFLDGRGYHNDTDGYTDYDALEDAFARAAELGITTEHIENIRMRINEPDFILKTSAAIAALSAYNQSVEADGEAAGLSAFFNTIAPEDFVRDRENSIDDTSVFDREERDQVREATLRIEQTFEP